MHAKNSRKIPDFFSLENATTALGERRRVLHRRFCIAEIHLAHHNRLNEFQQYQTAYVELTLARPNAVVLVIYAWKLLGLHKSKQGNTTNLNIFFPWKMNKELLRWDSNPRHTAYEADDLPTELSKQLSWLGRIKARATSLT